MLCKHEVVGSIPSASTRNFGWVLMSDRDENNFKTFSVFRQCAPHGQRLISPRYNFACRSYEIDCGIYDIVKRRSFRGSDLQAIAGAAIIISRN